jgi:hypothetical protein
MLFLPILTNIDLSCPLRDNSFPSPAAAGEHILHEMPFTPRLGGYGAGVAGWGKAGMAILAPASLLLRSSTNFFNCWFC